MTEPLDAVTEMALRDRLRDGNPVPARFVERMFAKMDLQTCELVRLRAQLKRNS